MVTRLLSIAPILIFAVFCILGLVQFRLWQQATWALRIDSSLPELLADFHGLRHVLVLPVLKLSDWTGVPQNRLFSLTMPALIFAIAFYSARSTQRLSGQKLPTSRAVIFSGISVFFIVLSMFMNGRMMFAMTGSSLLMWTVVNWEHNRDSVNLFAVVASIFLASVSSGSFVTLIVSFYFFLVVSVAIGNSSVCRRRVLITYSILLALLTPYLKLLSQNLMIAFGGGSDAIVKMLGHGYGAKLTQLNLAIFVVGIVLVSLLGLRYRHLVLSYWIPFSFISFALIGGLFGISTATIMLPPLLVVGILIIINLLFKSDNSDTELLS